MKTFTAIIMAACLLLSACAAPRTINNVTYVTYGLFNEPEKMNPDIEYKINNWNVFWSIVLCETIIVPLYIIGFDLYEPVGPRNPNAVKGQITKS